MRRGTAALALAMLNIVGYAALTAVGLMNFPPDLMDPVSGAISLGAVAAFSLMGAVLIRRAPANLIGALLLASGTAQLVGVGLQTYGIVGSSAVPVWPGAGVAAALTDLWFIAPFMIALIGIPLVFPDGRLPSRRFRPVVWVVCASIVLQALAGLAPLVPGLTDVDAVVSVLTVASLLAIAFGFGGAGVAIWVRFRRGNPVQRQQLKWLLADAGVTAIAFPLAMVFGPSDELLALACWVIGFLGYLALPFAIGIAVLRYRLYEIDRIISRTIGYAAVTITLAAVFAGAILLLEAVLAPVTGGNTLAVAASTLLVAALFQPLRRRVQRAVDRRFNRARYHAERTVAAFVAQLRDEVNLESLGADIRTVAAQTVAPAAIGLWLRRPEVGSGPATPP